LNYRYIIWLFELNNLAYEKQSFPSGASFAKAKPVPERHVVFIVKKDYKS